MSEQLSSNKQQEFTAENFRLAVEQLYNRSSSNEILRQANTYLLDFEKTNEAWDISIQIMNTQNLDDVVYFNASQIIAKKLRFDFGNYTENKDIQEKLGTFLIEKILMFKGHQNYLLSNLCKCFSLFIVFAHKLLPDIIKQLVTALSSDDIRSVCAILNIFTFAAENVLEGDIVVDQNYKQSFEAYLLQLSEQVIIFLNNTVGFINTRKKELISQDPSLQSYFRLMNKHVRRILTFRPLSA
jgi:hypothetical protein